MKIYQDVFERREKKYRINEKQRRAIAVWVDAYMQPEHFDNPEVCSLYYDTPDHLLIERSLDKPVYKEKLRIRSYGLVGNEGAVFIEIKKKLDGIVYKRRIPMSVIGAREYLAGASFEGASRRHPLHRDENVASANRWVENQTLAEIAWMKTRYVELEPSMFISSKRKAYVGQDDLRLTFDEDILWRDKHLFMSAGIGGRPLLREDESIMEIKTSGAIPLDLVQVLNEAKARPSSFSKYGNAYKASILATPEAEPGMKVHVGCGRIAIPELQTA